VGYNAAEIFLIFELKYYHENKFFSKMIWTHESGAQEDQFDGKKRRPKISWYYPFNDCFFLLPSERVGHDEQNSLFRTIQLLAFTFLQRYQTI
jgi:hypothetical protein